MGHRRTIVARTPQFMVEDRLVSRLAASWGRLLLAN